MFRKSSIYFRTPSDSIAGPAILLKVRHFSCFLPYHPLRIVLFHNFWTVAVHGIYCDYFPLWDKNSLIKIIMTSSFLDHEGAKVYSLCCIFMIGDESPNNSTS